MNTNKSIKYMYLHKSTWGTGESFSSVGHLIIYQLHILRGDDVATETMASPCFTVRAREAYQVLYMYMYTELSTTSR